MVQSELNVSIIKLLQAFTGSRIIGCRFRILIQMNRAGQKYAEINVLSRFY